MLFIIFIGSYWWGSLKNNFTRETFIFVLGNSYNRKTTCCILCTNDKNSWLPQGRLWGVLPAWICLLVLWHALYQNNFLIFYYILYFLFSSLFCVKNDNAFHLELMKIKCPIHSSLIESQLHIKKLCSFFLNINMILLQDLLSKWNSRPVQTLSSNTKTPPLCEIITSLRKGTSV